MRNKGVQFQLVPPSIHRQNIAERAMRTWKEHAKATISTFDPDLPLQIWCQYLEAMDIQLNMLRASRLHPQISSHCHVNGEFDYLRTPMVPLGTKTTPPPPSPSFPPLLFSLYTYIYIYIYAYAYVRK